jgi:DNA-binding transcriptional ArsR family regulator
MTKSANATQLDDIFMALSHWKRREMIASLALQPATMKQLADRYNLSLPAMHKHVVTLEQAKLITRRKVGRTNFIALSTGSLRLLQSWTSQFHTEWGSDEQTLENYIASMHTDVTPVNTE